MKWKNVLIDTIIIFVLVWVSYIIFTLLKLEWNSNIWFTGYMCSCVHDIIKLIIKEVKVHHNKGGYNVK
jgi:hypothetical protein